jgi:hypothetical protein
MAPKRANSKESEKVAKRAINSLSSENKLEFLDRLALMNLVLL